MRSITVWWMFNQLSDYDITLKKRQDSWSRRLWLNYKDKDNYEFVCESKTIRWCLKLATKLYWKLNW